VIEPADIPEAMRDGRGRRVLLTFDDGYRDNYEIAFPLLRRHGLRATFFLTTGFIDRPHAAWWDEIAWMVRVSDRDTFQLGDRPSNGLASMSRDARIAELIAHYKTLPAEQGEELLEQIAEATGSGRCDSTNAEDLWMTWDMARELQAAGMSIGGHTVTHAVLARVSPERQREEIATCARRLAEELRAPMRWFAYPVGSRDAFTAATQQILRECDVELAFSSYGGLGRPARLDRNPLDLPRVSVDARYEPQLLRATISLPHVFAR
jgi:peptidoglycan/xylan/chitin deacetylase (PgdA/CDA1 family)